MLHGRCCNGPQVLYPAFSVGASTVTEVVAIAALTEYAARKLSEPEPDTECPAPHIRLLFAISAILPSFFYLLNCELNSMTSNHFLVGR